MSEKKRYVEFIVGVDADGGEIEVTCDPEELNNAFNSRPEQPSYFIPVFFKRAVLDRYYARPDLYVVGEAGLSHRNEWDIRMDASRSDFVAMMLGDPGKYLPYEDQLHWRSCNVIPQGEFSKEFVDRNFRNRASYWTQPDHAFIDRLSGFKIRWNGDHGWPLFLELGDRDQHMIHRCSACAASRNPGGVRRSSPRTCYDSLRLDQRPSVARRDRRYPGEPFAWLNRTPRKVARTAAD